MTTPVTPTASTPLLDGVDAAVHVQWRGRVPYLDGFAAQRELVDARGRGDVPDTVLLLEHDPVFTLGRAANDGNVVWDAQRRAAEGVELVQADRGGDVTYHGPGQLVGYPIVKLHPKLGVVDWVRALEDIGIAIAAHYGITGQRVDGYSGVWVTTPTGLGKIMAIGVRVDAKRVTKHGFAFNVAPNLKHFTGIIPCGIVDEDKSVTSLAALGVDASVDDVVTVTSQILKEHLDG